MDVRARPSLALYKAVRLCHLISRSRGVGRHGRSLRSGRCAGRRKSAISADFRDRGIVEQKTANEKAGYRKTIVHCDVFCDRLYFRGFHWDLLGSSEIRFRLRDIRRRQVMQEWTTLTKAKPEHFLQPARYDGAGVTRNRAFAGRSSAGSLVGVFRRRQRIAPDSPRRHPGRPLARAVLRDLPGSEAPQPAATDRLERRYPRRVDSARRIGRLQLRVRRTGQARPLRQGPLDASQGDPSFRGTRGRRRLLGAGRRRYGAGAQTPFDPFEPPFDEDTILRVSEDGKVLAEISLPGCSSTTASMRS